MNTTMNAAANGIANSRRGGAPGSDSADTPALPTPARTFVFGAFLALAFVGFIGLGVWQLQRMAWKDALIARVDARIHAEPVAPPARAQWPSVSEAGDAYRRVRAVGRFLDAPEARTQAVTELGPGVWSLAPLRMENGDIVYVNRGFVPQKAQAAPPPSGPVEVVGLLRIGEPHGGFLRRNVPEQERWYSRDVAAIAQRRGLPADAVAPFFIDAATVVPVAGAGAGADNGVDTSANAGPDAAIWPRGGMTVVRFRDSHLTYALTWFGMAALSLFAGLRLLVLRRRLRQDRSGTFAR